MSGLYFKRELVNNKSNLVPISFAVPKEKILKSINEKPINLLAPLIPGRLNTYIYDDEKNYFFIEPKSFEQIEIKKDIVGEKGKLLVENLEVIISFYNETAISVELPNQVNCKIKATDAALKGQTVSSSYKPATLENGLNIQVPPFIEVSDEIVVDTRTLEYIKKI